MESQHVNAAGYDVEKVAASKGAARMIIGALVLAVLVICGALIVAHKAPFAFGSGDHALFHAFGHWINHGEVFTKDFIHFRTPGPYYYYAAVQHFLGDTQLATSMALLAEAHVGQLIASFALALVVSNAFWGRSSLVLAACTGAVFLVLPAIYQLRTAIPALALAAYIYYLLGKDIRLLAAAGVLMGLSFWFGQEVCLFLLISIGAAEISSRRPKGVKPYFSRALVLLTGFLLVMVPVLLYFYGAGVSLKELFYNTLYYAFFIQPKGMDSPFPDFSLTSVIFYAWIWAYIICAMVFALNRALGRPEAIVLFSYIGLRMVSMLGRSDFLHLLFSISELFILVPITVAMLWQAASRINLKSLALAAIVAVSLAVIFYVGINGRSSILLVIPVLLVVLSYVERGLAAEGDVGVPVSNKVVCVVAALLGLAVTYTLTLPYSRDSIKSMPGVFKAHPTNLVLGTQTPLARKTEIDAVQQVISEHKATNIFSYPIRAEYYALTPKHGSRYVEFAPQTTQEDVQGAISDLTASRPQLVIRDLDQVAFLSPILHNLSDFVMSNYYPIKNIEGYSHLEILQLRDHPVVVKRLFDNVYSFNPDHNHVTGGTRTKSDGSTVLVIATNVGQGVFKLERDGAKFVEAAVYPEPGAATTGLVTISIGSEVVRQTVSLTEGKVFVALPPGTGTVTITLESAEQGRSILWEDPKLVEERSL